MKQANIQGLQFAKTWQNREGKTMFQFEIELDDGVYGECNSISENPPYKVGETIYYEINGQSPQGVNRMKIHKNPSQPRGGSYSYNKKGDPVGTQWAINAARECLLARGEDVSIQNLQLWANMLIKMRDEIVENSAS